MQSRANKIEPTGSLEYRNAMAEVPASVNVVTTVFEGQRFGFTASAVSSVSDDPPTLLVCINRASSSFQAFASATHFCVNTLSKHQVSIADAFGGKARQEERFDVGNWSYGTTGQPVLSDAAVQFECELMQFLDLATHRILFGRVLNTNINEDVTSLVYHKRQYRIAEELAR